MTAATATALPLAPLLAYLLVFLLAPVPAMAADPGLAPPAQAAFREVAQDPASVPVPEPSGGMSVERLIQTVLTHNPDLLAAQRAHDMVRAGVISASARENPRLEWGAGRNTVRLPGVVEGATQTLGVSQFIENPSVRSARIDAARAAERRSAYGLAVSRNALVAQARQGAYLAVLREAEAAAAQEAVLLLEQVRERVRLRVESGEAARYEIIKADAEIINARQRQRTAALQAEQALLGLNRLAAGQLPARWRLAADLDVEVAPGELEELQQLARLNNPELQSLQSQLDRAQNQLEGARSSRWPGVDLRYSETTAADTRQHMLGVQMQIPLFDQRRGPIAEASSERERVRIRLEGRQAELQQQVLQAWKSLEMARLRVEALAQGVMREAEAALRVAQAAYRYGERGILDVLDAQRVLQSVRGDLLDARYELQSARIELELLSGRHADTQP